MENTKFRKNIRLKNYDYSENGYYPTTRLCVLDTPYRCVSGWWGYFVTICAKYKRKIFESRIFDKYGCVASRPWRDKFKKNSDIIEAKISNIEKKFSVEVDYYCIMSNHVHLILILENDCGCSFVISGKTRQGRAATSLPWIINAFKGWCTREFKEKLWQSNYYEHIIRNEKALSKIREYIQNNPLAERLDWDKLDI